VVAHNAGPGGSLGGYTNPNGSMGSNGSTKNTTPAPVQVVQTAAGQSPNGFPSGVPIEAGATIVSNFSALTAGTQQQSAEEFISKVSLAQNFTLYQAWLKKGDWTVTNTVNTATQKILFASLGKNNLTIHIYIASDGKVHVSITNFTTV